LKAVGFILEAVVEKGQLSELFPDNLSARLVLSPPTVSASILHLFFFPIYHTLTLSRLKPVTFTYVPHFRTYI